MSNTPTPEEFTDSFPHSIIPCIQGKPTYDSLCKLKQKLCENAASVPLACRGGANGYLGIVVLPAAYATISNTAWVDPVSPGVTPIIPAATTTAN